jgi:hypothetical protein
MRNLSFFLLLTIVLFPIFSEQTKNTYKYKNLEVSWTSFEESDTRKLVFEKKDKSILKEFSFEFEKFLEFGEFKPNEESYLYVVTHSGGESGGTLIVRFFDSSANNKQYYEIELSGYGNFQVVDLNKDQKEEFKVPSEKFYGLKLVDRNLGDCNITPSLYLRGFNETNLPEYYTLQKNAKGILEKVNITYIDEFKDYLQPYIQKIETRLSTEANKTYSGGEDYFQDIFQYYFYMKKTGNKKLALEKIKKANITVEMYCSKKKDKIYAKLDKLVHKYFEKNK